MPDNDLMFLRAEDETDPLHQAMQAGASYMIRMASEQSGSSEPRRSLLGASNGGTCTAVILTQITGEREIGAAMVRTAYLHSLCRTKGALEEARSELQQLIEMLPDIWPVLRGEKPQRPTRQMGVDE